MRVGVVRDAEVVGHRPEREEAGPHADARLRVEAQVDGGKPQRRGVEHRAARGDPRTVSDRGAEEAQDADRHVRLLELGEPLLPGAPEVVEQVEALHLLGTDQHVHPRRRLPGPHLELRDPHLAARERGVDRREVRDQETEEPEPGRGLGEGQDVGGQIGRSHEAEREQRGTTHLEGTFESADAEGVEHRGVRRHHHHHPHHRQEQQPHRSVQRHHRVAPVVGPCRSREPVEDHPESDERRPGHHGSGPAREHEGTQGRVEHEEHQRDPEREPQDGGDHVHGRAAWQTAGDRRRSCVVRSVSATRR